MTFEEAIKASVKKYFDNETDDDLEINKMNPDRKYTKQYFSKFEDEILGERRAAKEKLTIR